MQPEILGGPPGDADAVSAAVGFLRHLDQLADPADKPGVLVRRVEADVLELIIHAKRRELGVRG
jgi:hypothetical protein